MLNVFLWAIAVPFVLLSALFSVSIVIGAVIGVKKTFKK